MTNTSDMAEISYGIRRPRDLLEKLVADGNKLGEDPHPHDLFNFFVTAAVLWEWISKVHRENEIVQAIYEAIGKEDFRILPIEFCAWIDDKDCLPNSGLDIRRYVFNTIQICRHTANASKHFRWKCRDISAIESAPAIKDWFQYFFTDTTPSLYIEYSGEYYSVRQINGILVQFYGVLLSQLPEKMVP